MTAWAMAHPWMVLAIALVVLGVTDAAIANVCQVLLGREKRKALAAARGEREKDAN